MEKLGRGVHTPMDINLLPPLHLTYAENPSDSGKVRVGSVFKPASELSSECNVVVVWYVLFEWK